jgi:RHS repeat-associated protein
VRNSANALFNKTTHTYTTSNPYTGVTFVALTRSDYFECEGQATCHQNAETFTYDAYGNRTQKNDLGDVGTTGDERTEVTDWIIDTSTWIHRPKRVALLNNSGATVRERWLYYDGGAWNTLGARGLLTKEESRLTGGVGDSGNPTITYGYDIYGNRTSVNDVRSCPTTTVFESSQTYASTITNCLNHTTTLVYDHKFGVITSQTDANGQITSSEYDALGRPTKVIGPLDTNSTYGTVSTFYLEWGNPSSQRVITYRTEQHGTGNYIWSEEYFDGLGRGYKSQKEGPNGQTIVAETQFDVRGQVWKTSAPRFTSEAAVWTEFLYDVLGRQTRINFPDGTNTQTLYDHHEVTTIDPRGKIKRTHSDSHHRVAQVEEVNGGTSYFTNYEYDAADKLVKVTNAAGHNTLNVYDALGRKIAMCDPNMGTSSTLTSCGTNTPGAWVYTYNKAGDLLTQKDAKGQTICFEYDSLGRPSFKRQGASCTSAPLITWTYDDAAVQFSKGRVTQIVDQATTSKFFYDQVGRTTRTERLVLGQPQSLSQTYDALSRITSETFPDNEQVTYNYNSGGWLQSVTATSGLNYINDIQYNARGQKKTVTYGNNLVTTFTYNDPVDRPSVLPDFRVYNRTTSANQQNLTYGYDQNGNVTAITDSLFTGSRTFGYDALNRMPSASGTFGTNQANQNCTYAYSSIGNLTNKCGSVLTYGDANHPSAVTNHAGTGKNYTYDPNGNMLTRGTQTLTWDIDNRVTSVGISGGGTTSMEYDYAGIRFKKTGPSGMTLYPFQGYEIDPNGVITKLIKVGGEILASKRGANKYFYHNDHLGGVNVITDSNAQRCQLIEYSPWGGTSRSEVTNPACDPSRRFTGQELDPETGLYYYGGRYYDPEISRFASPDPFVQAPHDPQNLNRYSYVLNNPQNLVDPDGYFHKVKKPSFFKRFIGVFVGAVLSVFTAGFTAAFTAAAIAAGEIGATAAISTTASLTLAGSIGGFVGGAVSTQALGGNFLRNAFGGAVIGGITAGGLGGGIFGGIGFGPGSSPFGILAADMANASIRGFVVGTIASATAGEKFSDALRHGLLSAGIHAGSVAINTAIGHAVGYLRSGGGTPTVITSNGQSSAYYEVPDGQPGSFGNVVSGDRGWMETAASQGTLNSAPYKVFVHEIFHGPQSGVLGLAYGVAHLISMGVSKAACGNTHECNPLERFLHPFPDYIATPVN